MRKNRTTSLALSLWLFGLVLTQSACTTMSAPSEVAVATKRPEFLAGGTLRWLATVENIDDRNHLVTVRGPAGHVRTFEMHPSIKEFHEVAPGDRILAEYADLVAVYRQPSGVAIPSSEAADAHEALRHADRSTAVAVDSLQTLAIVQSADPTSHTVILYSADGHTHIITINPKFGSIERLKSGDQVILQQLKVMSVAISRPTP